MGKADDEFAGSVDPELERQTSFRIDNGTGDDLDRYRLRAFERQRLQRKHVDHQERQERWARAREAREAVAVQEHEVFSEAQGDVIAYVIAGLRAEIRNEVQAIFDTAIRGPKSLTGPRGERGERGPKGERGAPGVLPVARTAMRSANYVLNCALPRLTSAVVRSSASKHCGVYREAQTNGDAAA